jgi:GTP-binding protein
MPDLQSIGNPMKPVVALVGRPNVGKSTLFNRITRTKNALVDNAPGVTRDRHYGEAVWEDIPFSVVDTGGYLTGDGDQFSPLVRSQVMQAIQHATVVVMVLDGKSGVSPYDRDIIKLFRNVSQPVFYVVNKIDGLEREVNLFEFYSLGIEELHPVSAEHNYGVPDFLDALIRSFPSDSPDDSIRASDDVIKIAVVGRPNVGKSSLINRLLGEDRLLVSDIPGTTRDAIDTLCRRGDQSYLLIDTAGIRRKSKVDEKIEKYSIIKSLKSMDRCDVALIVLDVEEGITEQDIHVAGYAFERGCGCIFLLNKWDRVEKDKQTLKRYVDDLRYKAKFLNFAPAVTISALTGLRVPSIFGHVDDVFAQYATRIGTGQLNKLFEQATLDKEPSIYKGKRLKFYYATQVSEKPPTFVAFVNVPEGIHFSYERYLINQIRGTFGLKHTPIRMMFRERAGRKP